MAARSSVTSPPPPEPAAGSNAGQRGGVFAGLRREWADAGLAARSVFVIAAIYWLLAVLITILTLPRVRNAYELVLVIGFYFVPLLYAVVLRAVYVFVRRGPRRPPLVSWWVLVLGALLAILVSVARTTVPA